MTKKILINATESEESRVAVLKEDGLHEFYVERPSMDTRLGNIYKGRISNIEPSIGAAFIDIGGPRNGFLHISDLNPALMDSAMEEEKDNAGRGRRGKGKDEKDAAGEKGKKDSRIREILQVGQELIVQVSKDGIGVKGPTLTSFVSLPGRFLVFMPGISKQGVSRKIEDDEERERLKNLVSELINEPGMGVIVRTAGASQLKRDLQKDFRYLTNIWNAILKRNSDQEAPSALYKEDDLVIRVLRDVFSTDVTEVLVDSKDVFRRARDFMKSFMPSYVEKIRLYRGKRPLFDRYKLEKELQSVLQPRIVLKSGGSLFIEQTEALVAIDVNSGKFKGGELEETAYSIDMEAAREIARQLRLRDMGGLIIIDFIDMRDPEHKRAVEKEFRDALKADRARIKMTRISPFGVIEMTRQRVRPSLESFVFEKCFHCKGTGFVATAETTSLNIIRKIRLWGMQNKNPSIRVRINDRMAEYIQNSKRRSLLTLEEIARKRIEIVGDPALLQNEILLEKTAASRDRQGMLFEDSFRRKKS